MSVHRCPKCPELGTFPTYAAAERHARQTGHHRLETVTTPRAKKSRIARRSR